MNISKFLATTDVADHNMLRFLPTAEKTQEYREAIGGRLLVGFSQL